MTPSQRERMRAAQFARRRAARLRRAVRVAVGIGAGVALSGAIILLAQLIARLRGG